MSIKNWNIETIAVQGTYTPDQTGAKTLPIHQSASFDLGNADNAADLFDLKVPGNIYTRITNPTNSALEEKVALLEGGIGALALSSGQAAITLSILNICNPGDHIISTSSLYGGTYSLFKKTFKKFSIDVSFVDQDAPIETLRSEIRENTKAVYAETIGNPSLQILDFEKFSKLAKEAQVPLIIDNTFASPYLFRPLEHGANIVIHSGTKYLGGHGNSIAGLIVDGGNFNWKNGKFSDFTTPDDSYHGLIYTEALGAAAFIGKARVQLLRDIGACLSPFNAFLIHTGIETLHLRMNCHSENALKLGKFLESAKEVEWVSYPGLPSSPSYERYKKYLNKGAGGMLTFGIKGGKEAGKRFINSLEIAGIVPNVGDAKTLVIHPASTTHRQLSDEDLEKSGVSPSLIRVSTGIENINDIIDDFKNGLKISQKGSD